MVEKVKLKRTQNLCENLVVNYVLKSSSALMCGNEVPLCVRADLSCFKADYKSRRGLIKDVLVVLMSVVSISHTTQTAYQSPANTSWKIPVV